MTRILETLSQGHDLGRTVVIIDVFRSSNTIIELLTRGAAGVVPVADIDEARRLRQHHADWLLLGERGGVKLPFCDADNSPTAIGAAVAGRTVLLTTSGGTRCIGACGPRQDVLIASFANASAVVHHLRRGRCADIVFWAVGTGAETPAIEDRRCAEYLSDLYEDRAADFDPIRQALRQSENAGRLVQREQTADLDFCLTLDSHTTVPFLVRGSGKMPWLTTR